jgi:hypothetical protein
VESKKYYIYTYRDGASGGKRWILAENEMQALANLLEFLKRYHPFRYYKIELEQVMPA